MMISKKQLKILQKGNMLLLLVFLFHSMQLHSEHKKLPTSFIYNDTIPPKRAHHELIYDEANKTILMTAGSTPVDGAILMIFLMTSGVLTVKSGSNWEMRVIKEVASGWRMIQKETNCFRLAVIQTIFHWLIYVYWRMANGNHFPMILP